MKYFAALLLVFTLNYGYANHDTLTFWEYAQHLAENEKQDRTHAWGSETVQYLGIVKWTSPSGKELDIRIVTTYRRITEANGFKDQSVLALVKHTHHLIKMYDFVSRQNLPIGIRDNMLVYKSGTSEITSAIPAKLAERFCVEGLNCFEEATLAGE
jgi:hypothetical protein